MSDYGKRGGDGPMPRYSVDCWQCGGEGYIEGDCTCGEDCCCCLEPEPPTCDICGGHGYYIVTQLTEDNADRAVLLPE